MLVIALFDAVRRRARCVEQWLYGLEVLLQPQHDEPGSFTNMGTIFFGNDGELSRWLH